MVLELKNVITATEREYLFLQVLRLVFFKVFILSGSWIPYRTGGI